jgi:hypothetical protein
MHGPAPRFSGLPGPAREEQRLAMLAKIEALISVLELARGKVLSNLTQHGVDVDRLLRVREQVDATLQVCRRARVALRGGGAPITQEQVKGTDLDALCERLSSWELS